MKKVTIKNKLGVAGWGAEMADPTAWIAECVAGNYWGLPERWVLHKDELMAEAYDDADVLEEDMRDTLEGVAQKWVKLKVEYTVEIEDITAQVAQEAINAEALAYLASTDWLVIREVDAGVPCPQDIKQKRAEARSKIVR
jgi:hypothetical protein